MPKTTRKTWTALENQILIDFFNKYKQDSVVARKLYRKIDRTERAIINQLHTLRCNGLVGDSARSSQMRNSWKTRKAEQPTVKQLVLEPVAKQTNDELMTLASYIVAQMTKEQKQQLVLSLIA